MTSSAPVAERPSSVRTMGHHDENRTRFCAENWDQARHNQANIIPLLPGLRFIAACARAKAAPRAHFSRQPRSLPAVDGHFVQVHIAPRGSAAVPIDLKVGENGGRPAQGVA